MRTEGRLCSAAVSGLGCAATAGGGGGCCGTVVDSYCEVMLLVIAAWEVCEEFGGVRIS